MKKSIKFLSYVLFGAAAIACSSPEKMAEKSENVTVTSDPAPLVAVAGKIEAKVTVTYPADYFHPKAILEVTPVLVYEGGEAKMEPFVYQGEKVTDNYKVVSSEGSTVTEKVSFDYVPGMEKSYLELRGVVKFGKGKTVEMPVKKVADGVNTTYMLVSKCGKINLRKDNYQEIIKQTAEGQVMYTINSSVVRSSQLKSDSVKDFLSAVEEIKANERKSLVSTDIVAYASPDGGEKLNTKLSDKRSESAEKAFNKLTKKNPIDAPVQVSSIGQDWEGFQELVAESDLEDKDLIIRVLSMYSDPAVREQEIKNMSAVYKSLAKEVLPELRRARFIANVEYKNYTAEELVSLINENIDVLDEEALLRAATLVKGDKVAVVYKKAIEKFGSDRAQYNLAALYYRNGDLKNAKTALEKVQDKDGEYLNLKGLIAVSEGKTAEAEKLFKQAGTASAADNMVIVNVLKGDYKAALAQVEKSKDNNNSALVYILNGQYDKAAASIKCACPRAAYLKAIVAARKGDAAGVKTNLEAAAKDKNLAARAAKDIEFAQFR